MDFRDCIVVGVSALATLASVTTTGTVSAQAMSGNAMTAPVPPVAKRVPHVIKSPHGDRVDEYYWLRDDDSKAKRPEIVEHLTAENAYADAMLAHVKPLQDRLVTEMRGRIKEDDSSVPVYDNGYWYWRRFDAGAEYPILLRQQWRACGSGVGCARGDRARHSAAGAPARVLQRRRHGRQPGQPVAGVRRGHSRPSHLHAALP